MSRCGCNSTCSCAFKVEDTSTVDMSLKGNGSAANPITVSGVVKVSADSGNKITVHSDGLYAAATSIKTENSDCITLTGDGTDANPLTATPVIAPEPNGLTCGPNGLVVSPSNDPNNTLVMGSDGNLYVSPTTDQTTVADTNTVDLSMSPTGQITGDVILSPDAGNTLAAHPNGLYAPAATGSETKVTAGTNVTVTGTGTTADPYVVNSADTTTVSDTPSVNLTETGSNITADVIISPDAGNQASIHPNGVFVAAPDGSETKVTAFDTSCINTTVTGTGTAADPYVVSSVPIIAPEPNGLTCGPNGLVVAPSTDAGNTLTIGTDGNLFTPPAASVNTVTVADTPSVNMSMSPTDVITSDVIISPDAGNQVSTHPNGLFVPAADGSETKVTVTDTGTVDSSITGNGTTATPYNISSVVKISPDAGNTTVANANGIFTPAPDGSETKVTAGTNVTVTGTGTAADPYVVNSTGGADTTTVADTNSVDLVLTGSQITANVKPGCGIEVDATGVRANTAAWPFACPQDSEAQDVYCSPTTGQLQGPPEKFSIADSSVGCTSPAGGIPIGSSFTGPLTTINNPSPCLPMRVLATIKASGSVEGKGSLGASLYLSVNGGAFNNFANQQPPGHNPAASPLLIGSFEMGNPYVATIPPGGSLTLQGQSRVVNQTADPSNTWHSTCVTISWDGSN